MFLQTFPMYNDIKSLEKSLSPLPNRCDVICLMTYTDGIGVQQIPFNSVRQMVLSMANADSTLTVTSGPIKSHIFIFGLV